MIRLVQTFGAHAGRELAFSTSLVRVGRMPDSDVAFDAHADLDASGRHAEFRATAQGWIVVDVGSRNGTFVNGKRVSEAPLRGGEEIEFGPGGPRLRVVELSAPQVMYDAATAPVSPRELSQPAHRPPQYEGGSASSRPPQYQGGSTPSYRPPPVESPVPPQGPLAGSSPSYRPPPYGTPSSRPQYYAEQTGGGGSQLSRRWYAVIASVFILGIALVAVAIWLWRKPPAVDPAQIAAANMGTLHWIVALPEQNTLCSAFAIQRRTLATSAQCVLAVESRQQSGRLVEVRSALGVRPHSRLWRHPQFVPGQVAADVGLIELTVDVPIVATLAVDGVEDLDETEVVALAFQAGAVTPLSARVTEVNFPTPDDPILILTTMVPDGSPVFDGSGRVVAAGSSAGGAVGATAIQALLNGHLGGN